MSDFVHLHCHTEYSLLDGAIRLKELCGRAKEFGMTACAITDHGNMFGAAYFYSACREYELKPIIGCEVYICRDHTDRTPEFAKNRNHLILLAQNNDGYHNLIKLVSHSYIKGFYYKPRVDKKLLSQYADGLICLSACIAGEIPDAILKGDMDSAKQHALDYMDIFPNRFYLELQANGLKEQQKVNDGLLELSSELQLPLVATNDCHYLNREDAYAHEVLVCIQTQKTMTDPTHLRFGTDELYFKSEQDMLKSFGKLPQAIANTAEIAAQCNVELDFGHHYIPVYKVPEGSSLTDEFRRLAVEGLQARLEKHPNRDKLDVKIYQDRLEYELKVIEEMGFPGYFLIVQEFINWAKDHGIPVGPGRGSAAGSLVAWALRITNLDPLPYNLLFERFLNIERVSLPDIDVDFCERRRIEVIRHMADTYGKDSVAQITTFGTMKAKGVVRDVGRALGMTYSETDRIAKLVPDDLKMTIDKALEQQPELKKLYTEDSSVKHLIDISKRLEGLTRHASTHAAGLVVSDKPMEEYLPLYMDKNEKIVTQFDGPMTEKTGLVKFDFLGLKTMTQIYDTLDNIRNQGKEVPDLDNLPLDDPETYELYSRGDTDGIFQVESSGMRQYLRMLKPSCFEDIIVMLALYRPGPLGSGMVDEFIKRKHGQVSVVYPHQSLTDCLRDTYGVIVYQEQVMQIAQIIANYTLGGADLLRRAMGKKKAEAMAKERSKFVEGARKNNIKEGQANDIFDLMEKFAAYGFNKSHSAAYALISYHTAWLKVHYKVEFMAALLTSEMGNQDKLLKYISACKDMGIEVVPPSINRSQYNFSAADGRIIYGLGGIKSVGGETVEEIIKLRRDKPFVSQYDLCYRVNSRRLNKRVLESLINSGALDCLGSSRRAQLACMDIVVARAQKNAKVAASPQASLFNLATVKKKETTNGVGIELQEASLPEFDNDQKLKNEKEALGFFLTSHPLQPYTHAIQNNNFTTLENCQDKLSGSIVNCAVLVTNVKEVVTKKGERMAFVSIEDLTGHAEVTFFPKDYSAARTLLNGELPLYLSAKIDPAQNNSSGSWDSENGDENVKKEIKLLGNGARLLSEVCKIEPGRESVYPQENIQKNKQENKQESNQVNKQEEDNLEPVYIRIPSKNLNEKSLSSLKKILTNYRGNAEVNATFDLENMECHLQLLNIRVRRGRELENALHAWSN